MRWLIESGHVADIAITLALGEWAVLAIRRRRTGSGLSGSDIAGNLLAGIALLLALRCALVGSWWIWIAGCLAAALAAHVADLRRRWRCG
jgi:hypothetical protein